TEEADPPEPAVQRRDPAVRRAAEPADVPELAGPLPGPAEPGQERAGRREDADLRGLRIRDVDPPVRADHDGADAAEDVRVLAVDLADLDRAGRVDPPALIGGPQPGAGVENVNHTADGVHPHARSGGRIPAAGADERPE